MPFIQTNGINFYYEERGRGGIGIGDDGSGIGDGTGGSGFGIGDGFGIGGSLPPLLLIMGITAPGAVWNVHLADWQQHFRCIVGDNRGVGKTDIPAGPYSTEQMADDYAGLLEALNIPSAQVIGCSMGSTIAQQLAIRHPEKVHSLVLMCPWARCDYTANLIFNHMMASKARLRPEEFSRFIHLLIYSKSSLDNAAFTAELEEGLRSDATNPDPQPLHGLEGQAIACMQHNVLEELSGIRKPTLVIGGKKDIFTPEWMAREVAAAIPGAELYLYENLGHGFHFENTPDFNQRIRNWCLAHA